MRISELNKDQESKFTCNIPHSAFCIPKLNMTQVIVCSTREGVVLATDSCATWFDQTGGMRHFNLKKLLRLSFHSAMVSAGAGIGVEIGYKEVIEEEVNG